MGKAYFTLPQRYVGWWAKVFTKEIQAGMALHRGWLLCRAWRRVSPPVKGFMSLKGKMTVEVRHDLNQA
jgi:hypothetical protein